MRRISERIKRKARGLSRRSCRDYRGNQGCINVLVSFHKVQRYQLQSLTKPTVSAH
jgi:hypothetical protein